jgi:hypothetical protein
MVTGWVNIIRMMAREQNTKPDPIHAFVEDARSYLVGAGVTREEASNLTEEAVLQMYLYQTEKRLNQLEKVTTMVLFETDPLGLFREGGILFEGHPDEAEEKQW